MSTFFVLPSRPLLGQRFADFLQTVFPGLQWQRPEWWDLAEALGHTALRRRDAYVVYREDVPEGDRLEEALTRDFGAEPGDEVVEVVPGDRFVTLTARRWRMGSDPRQVA
jgi:hypothetical protein